MARRAIYRDLNEKDVDHSKAYAVVDRRGLLRVVKSEEVSVDEPPSNLEAEKPTEETKEVELQDPVKKEAELSHEALEPAVSETVEKTEEAPALQVKQKRNPPRRGRAKKQTKPQSDDQQ